MTSLPFSLTAFSPRLPSPPVPERTAQIARSPNSLSLDPGVVLKTGARLVRQWGGHTQTVLVLGDGFEYEGQRYRSLTLIAARITGAHWSGPRFFGMTKRTSRSLSTTVGPGH